MVDVLAYVSIHRHGLHSLVQEMIHDYLPELYFQKDPQYQSMWRHRSLMIEMSVTTWTNKQLFAKLIYGFETFVYPELKRRAKLSDETFEIEYYESVCP